MSCGGPGECPRGMSLVNAPGGCPWWMPLVDAPGGCPWWMSLGGGPAAGRRAFALPAGFPSEGRGRIVGGMSDARINPFFAGLACRCPGCGRGPLFGGFLTVRPRCEVCGFDLQSADSGDGPVFFVALVGGCIVTFGAFFVEMKFEPPIWLQIVIWLPLTVLICGVLLRISKSMLIAYQFHFKAAQGQVAAPQRPQTPDERKEV
ncbi:MAG TPA: DUF983 domain-containing protein [Rhodopila sp.]|uniref:DUF983 domain-containing protein n=1 Tax=Rhodopila sp. TaxID=2480087 RepID=UPI002BB3EE72|nr:DUF983 domain-containing protein [Rhodopila sp.]HVY15694.1 DUF983 domain-containing protein [Rhodopila sp.]